jgi:hypothetical protein
MKQIIAVLMILTLLSCNEKAIIVNESVGSINKILVVTDQQIWESQAGKELQGVLTQSLDGLVREEPLFELNQMSPEGFVNLAKKSRNYIILKTGNSSAIEFEQNKYSKPQLGAVIKGTNTGNLADIIEANADQIRKNFKTSELRYKQQLMAKVDLNTAVIQKALGMDITIPNIYKFAIQEEDFFWLRRDIKDGTMDIMLYEVPLNTIKRDSNVVGDIIAMRDEMGKKIPTADDQPFITEQAFAPYVNEQSIDGKFAFETRGLWEVKDKFMSGPFLNYAIYNAEKNNWLVAEGYVFAPSAEQRDFMFELEAILRSISFETDK